MKNERKVDRDTNQMKIFDYSLSTVDAQISTRKNVDRQKYRHATRLRKVKIPSSGCKNILTVESD